MKVGSLHGQMKSGAYNFFWIAGLSMATSIFFLFSTRTNFVVGLGITQFMDTITTTLPNPIQMQCASSG